MSVLDEVRKPKQPRRRPLKFLHVSKMVHYRKDSLAGVVPYLIRGDGQTLNKGANQAKRKYRAKQAGIRAYDVNRGYWTRQTFPDHPHVPKVKNLLLTEEVLEDHGWPRPWWAEGVVMDLATMREAIS